MFDHQVKPMVAIEVNILHFVCKFCIFFRGSCENDYDISFIAFGCNAKSFVVAWVVVFFSSFSSVFQKWTGKGFFQIYNYWLPRKLVTKIQLVSMDILANISLMICLLLLEKCVTHDQCHFQEYWGFLE